MDLDSQKRLFCNSERVDVSRPQAQPCADTESFVRGGPTLTFLVFLLLIFSLMWGGRIQIPLLAGHQRPASDTPFKWRFA